MAYKTWSAGDVLTASDVNTYLGAQAVIVCTSGTRPSSPVEGMTVYETDTDRYAKYTGSAWEYWAGSRVAVTPTLTAATTNPTLGTGSKATGWYCYLPGPSVCFSFFVKFGTSGANAGSGQYLISLPVAAANAHSGDQPAMGACLVRDNSASDIRDGTIYIPGSNLSVVAFLVNGTSVTDAAPWVWAASDYLSGTITYPI